MLHLQKWKFKSLGSFFLALIIYMNTDNSVMAAETQWCLPVAGSLNTQLLPAPTASKNSMEKLHLQNSTGLHETARNEDCFQNHIQWA